MKDQLLEAGAAAISYGEKLGVDLIEVFMEATKSLEVSVEGSKLRSVSVKNDHGCGIRVISEKRTGFSFATSIEDSSIMDAVDKAFHLAKIAAYDKEFHDLPHKFKKYPVVKSVYDKKICQMTPESAIDIVMRAIDSNKEVLEKHSPIHYVTLNSKELTQAIVNSNSLSCSSQMTTVSMLFDVTVRINGKQGNSWDEQVSTNLDGLDSKALGSQVGKDVLRTIKSDEIEGGSMPVILSQDAIAHLLNSRRLGSLAGSLNYMEVSKLNSYLVDQIGCAIANECVSIYDDALLEGGFLSRPFDAEGCPSKGNDLIRDGILQTYLHDSYTSNKSGLANTANSWRKSYSEPPTIAPSNMILKPGTVSEEEMISDIKKGIYCRFTGDLPNPISGDLNAIVMQGYLIESGEISHALDNTMFSISMLDLLKNISLIGNNPKETENGIFPSVKIEKAHITSGKT